MVDHSTRTPITATSLQMKLLCTVKLAPNTFPMAQLVLDVNVADVIKESTALKGYLDTTKKRKTNEHQEAVYKYIKETKRFSNLFDIYQAQIKGASTPTKKSLELGFSNYLFSFLALKTAVEEVIALDPSEEEKIKQKLYTFINSKENVTEEKKKQKMYKFIKNHGIVMVNDLESAANNWVKFSEEIINKEEKEKEKEKNKKEKEKEKEKEANEREQEFIRKLIITSVRQGISSEKLNELIALEQETKDKKSEKEEKKSEKKDKKSEKEEKKSKKKDKKSERQDMKPQNNKVKNMDNAVAHGGNVDGTETFNALHDSSGFGTCEEDE